MAQLNRTVHVTRQSIAFFISSFCGDLASSTNGLNSTSQMRDLPNGGRAPVLYAGDGELLGETLKT